MKIVFSQKNNIVNDIINKMLGTVYKIYLVECPRVTYIGSTFRQLDKRCKPYNYNKTALDCWIKIFGWDAFKIEVIKEYDVDNRELLREYEQYWIDNLLCINKYKAKRDKQEYHRDYYVNNRDKLISYSKGYFERNKDVINQKKKDVYNNTKKIVYCAECDKYILNHCLFRHNQSKKHVKNVYNIDNIIGNKHIKTSIIP